MYNVPIYKEKDEKSILEFLNEYPFGLITGVNSKGIPVATQLPFLFEKRGDDLYLLGHMMKNTDHFKAFEKNPTVLVVFSGPNGYVSATWGNNKSKGSTWNYMSVHCKGNIVFFEGKALVDFMKKFTLTFEDGNTTSPTIYQNLPDAYTSKWMPHIIGFEIKVEHLDTVFKLSQGLDKESYLNIISQLEKRGGTNSFLAKEMKKRVPLLFT